MKLWSSGGQEREKDTNPKESRILGFFDLFTIGLGSSLAVGIFVLSGSLIKNVAGPAAVVSVSLAGVTALFGGLCFSEFGVRFIKVNSAYAYSYFWGRENAAFFFGWILILEYVAGSASVARGIITFTDALAEYKISQFLTDIVSTNFQDIFPYFDFFSFGIVLLVTISIIFGFKDFLIIKKIFTICNVVLVTSVITAGAFKADLSNWQTEQTGFAPFGALGVVKGAAIAFYGFIGFDRISIAGNEVRKQKRNLPAAILFTIFVAFLAYAGVAVVLSLMLPYDKLDPNAALPFAFQELGCPEGKWVVAIAALFGFQTSLFGAVFPLPRIIHAMANDGLLFPFLGNSHQKVPILASVIGGLLTAAAAGIFTFQKLVSLTVIGALFIYTILAINIILFRYSPKPDNDEMLSDSWKNLISKNSDISVKAVVKNYFNFRVKQPTNLTGRIITWNIILFCISSVGLGVVFNFFYDSLFEYSPMAVVPAGILFSFMLFNLISMTCQPKSQEPLPFKVPLIPLLPCVSVFLNIFLMVTFESVIWIIFSGWIAVGLLPHFAWRLVKYFKREMGENSLYEINRTNTVKLNESIWKIKLDKKNFYEGAVNHAFSDDMDDRFHEINGGVETEVKSKNEKTVLQLKQAEIIQTAELVVEEKADSLRSDLELDFIRVDNEETGNELTEENEKVLWECVAEIHTEEEFEQESVALEIVDNTYNFLCEVSDELSKDVSTYREPAESEKESLSESENFFRSTENPNSISSAEDHDENSSKTQQNFRASELRTNENINKDTELQKVSSDDFEDNEINEIIFVKPLKKVNCDLPRSTQELNSIGIVENFNEKQIEENISNTDNIQETNAIESSKFVSDEQNTIKEFKDKLNQLLKNQVNNENSLLKNSATSKPVETGNIDPNNNENNKDAGIHSIKTLNKSQIKNKLELLLSKGPPKRPSLRDSFNIKLNEANAGNNLGRTGEEMETRNGAAINGKNVEKQFVEPPTTLQDSIKEKILALKSVRSELPKDVCC